MKRQLSEEEHAALLAEKEEHEAKRAKLGILRSQYKKMLRAERHVQTKDTFRAAKRDRRKLKRQQDKEQGISKAPRPKQYKAKDQIQTHSGVLVDCEFDDLMNDKEIKSMANQINRIYSAKRRCPYDLNVVVTPLNKRLLTYFDTVVPNYRQWKSLDIQTKSVVEAMGEHKDQYIYLTADTDEIIEEIEPHKTYIIGGIVDKNRHKELCVNKAKQLGLKVGKLPIEKYIKINGRQVLATSHVFEIMCKWWEYRDWERAFNEVLPKRKVGVSGSGSEEPEDPAEPVDSADPEEELEEELEEEEESEEEGEEEESKEKPEEGEKAEE